MLPFYSPLVTVVIPSMNQGRFLEKALDSIFSQNIPVEVFVIDGGSTDETLSIINRWEDRISGWRSYPDLGQSSAINEGVAWGRAPYVCWINSDDWMLPGSLEVLIRALDANPTSPAVYGQVLSYHQNSGKENYVWVEKFSKNRLSIRCIISQPGTLIRRSAWEAVNGLDASLFMAMDYDLWWRLFITIGPLKYIDKLVAVNREHSETKTKNFRLKHYVEAMKIVKKYNGYLPIKWWLLQPYSIWFKSLKNICYKFFRME
ncbi:glycosyltransferase [Polynucleobacter sp. MWH-Berg-3C6]|nr:glycosyltransferase [Polynucleobacter sp. MWH-Berg-3C6]